MALFGNKKKKTVAVPAARASATAPGTGRDLAGVLIAPWFSEKALIGTEKGIYVFSVPPAATKHDVAAAVESIYKVKPRMVRMVNLPAKKKALRNRRGTGTRARRHKAYVYLQKGETLAIA
jgi:large subunit ribosomal protein L23